MNDLISRQAAIDAPERFIKDCNPEHFVGHQKFIEYMDDAEIGSFGNWQFANGFNMGLTATEVAIEKLPPAYPLNPCETCLHKGKGWDEDPCDGCTGTESKYEPIVSPDGTLIVNVPKGTKVKRVIVLPYADG